MSVVQEGQAQGGKMPHPAGIVGIIFVVALAGIHPVAGAQQPQRGHVGVPVGGGSVHQVAGADNEVRAQSVDGRHNGRHAGRVQQGRGVQVRKLHNHKAMQRGGQAAQKNFRCFDGRNPQRLFKAVSAHGQPQTGQGNGPPAGEKGVLRRHVSLRTSRSPSRRPSRSSKRAKMTVMTMKAALKAASTK